MARRSEIGAQKSRKSSSGGKTSKISLEAGLATASKGWRPPPRSPPLPACDNPNAQNSGDQARSPGLIAMSQPRGKTGMYFLLIFVEILFSSQTHTCTHIAKLLYLFPLSLNFVSLPRQKIFLSLSPPPCSPTRTCTHN